ncbi:FUSC family protein [Microbacterium aurantiacum]|uniref:FUSC family protein n=1 Tax=Microbacterium aurantiacum TaxID=162393 RepID=UPI003D726450
MPETRAPRVRGAVTYAARLAAQPRLLLAVKTAVAAVLAWYLAPMIPFAEDQYSYYGALGALVTMHPTVARSARVGGEVLMGLVLGIALSLCGVAALRAGVPGGLVLGVVIGVAVLLGGWRFLGTGGDWVALAGLFVLLAAGGDPEGFSVSYLGTVAFGIVIGIAVNLLVVPPLYIRRAGEQLSLLRDELTTLLDEASDALARGDVDRDGLAPALARVDEVSTTVREEVREAEESARANPRRRRHVDERDENMRRMEAMERLGYLAHELVELLVDVQDADPALGPDGRQALARAIAEVSDLVAAPVGDPDARSRLAAASRALDAYEAGIVSPDPGLRRETAAAAAIDLCLRRIIDATRPFV